MFALAALIYFIVSGILAWNNGIQAGHLWAVLFIGLGILSAHFVYTFTPWQRTRPPV